MLPKLPYLNLGCGSHFNPNWVNVDFAKMGDEIIGHNLLNGIPFDDNTFEVVYHSHVLEHFQKEDAVKFIKECYRVLKPGGIIRIAIPDLEQIVSNYNRLFTIGMADPDNEKIRANYDWIMIEMYDQAVRNESGGQMLKYLSKKTLENENFIYQRMGYEGYMIRQGMIMPKDSQLKKVSVGRKIYRIIRRILSPNNVKKSFLKLFFYKEYKLMELGRFRLSGEVHHWMYDIYSLGNLLKDAGFKNIEKKDFDESSILAWKSFSLDEINNVIRKPDSLFAEAVK